MGGHQFGLIDNWLRNIKDVYRLHAKELDSIVDEEARFNRLVEINVVEQVFDLTKTSIIQNAWRTRQEPFVHGWVYSLHTGLIKDLNVSFGSDSKLPNIYTMDASIVPIG
jgi:carbonic anhydrase